MRTYLYGILRDALPALLAGLAALAFLALLAWLWPALLASG